MAFAASVRDGLHADLARPTADELLSGTRTDSDLEVTLSMPVRGIATSGWRGCSLLRGIADGATILTCTPAAADATATLIANAVNVPRARIVRQSA